MRCQVKDVTVPTASNTYVLLDTFTALNGITLPTHEIARYILTVNNTQAGFVRASRSEDGVTYRVFERVAVGIPVAPIVDSGPLDFACQGVQYLKVEWENGGTNQTTWNPIQELVEKQRAAQT
jgi:hypothetical protein